MSIIGNRVLRGVLVFVLGALVFSWAGISCASSAASAEEYYSIGMAYYELGKFAEAEKWLLRAATADKTRTASEYNLGRIAFEAGRYQDAAGHFENILKQDPNNVMALKAAAYTHIKTGGLAVAESLYDKVVTLVPESFDNGYNYALVLYALEKYETSLAVLSKYPFALDENPEALLLLARSQASLNKVEAADSYAKWLAQNTTANPRVLYEYAGVLEKAELYALALEQYRASVSAMTVDSVDLKKSQIRFDIARLLLIADPDSVEGITELNNAIGEGFGNKEALAALLADSRINGERKTEIQQIIDSLNNPVEPGTGEPL